MRQLSVLDERLGKRFADGSGDRNPLHCDAAFGRKTSYGGCIVYGALGALMALRELGSGTLRNTSELNVRFPSAVFFGEPVRTSAQRGEGHRTVAVLETRGTAAVQIAVVGGGIALGDVLPGLPVMRTEPRATDAQTEIVEDYAPGLAELRKLADDLGAGHVPDALLIWLAAASYTIGMLAPGVDALFASARIWPAPDSVEDRTIAVRSELVGRSNLRIVHARLAHGPASANMELRAFVRPPVPTIGRKSIAKILRASDKLAGRNILVIGASGGLGAAITAGLATQGAVAWAAYNRGASDVEAIAREFGRARIRPIALDATDPASTLRGLAAVRQESEQLDGLVLSAAPPLNDLPLHADVSEVAVRHVQDSFAMVFNPLVAALPLIAPNGWLAFISSSAVEDPPAGWAQYVAAKGAVEGLADHCARHTTHRVAVVRPPRMHTYMTAGPLGGHGATAVEVVAAALVSWIVSGHVAEPHRADVLSGSALVAR